MLTPSHCSIEATVSEFASEFFTKRKLFHCKRIFKVLARSPEVGLERKLRDKLFVVGLVYLVC